MPIYRGKQIESMRAACGLARDILLESAAQIKPGVTTGEVDSYAADLMKRNDCKSVWAQFSILAPSKKVRDDIVKFLKEHSVNVAIFYPSPLHFQDCFKYLNYQKGALPVTENICNRIFNLPCYGELTNSEKNHIVKILLKYNENNK